MIYDEINYNLITQLFKLLLGTDNVFIGWGSSLQLVALILLVKNYLNVHFCELKRFFQATYLLFTKD